MGRALILLAVAIVTGWLVYSWMAPRFLASDSKVTVSAPTSESPPAEGAAAPLPALAPPRTPEQQTRDTLEAQRAPFYNQIRQRFGPQLADVRPDPEDGADLDLYAANDDPQLLPQLLSQTIQPDAIRYGFRHVRFFVPNPPDEAERYRLDAEVTSDDQGNWQTFRK